MACGRGVEAPLDVALPKMFVNLVLIPGINSLKKHTFSSNQICLSRCAAPGLYEQQNGELR